MQPSLQKLCRFDEPTSPGGDDDGKSYTLRIPWDDPHSDDQKQRITNPSGPKLMKVAPRSVVARFAKAYRRWRRVPGCIAGRRVAER